MCAWCRIWLGQKISSSYDMRTRTGNYNLPIMAFVKKAGLEHPLNLFMPCRRIAKIMWSKFAVIGVIVGSIVISIGGASLVMHLGPITVTEEYTVLTGESVSYLIPAPEGTAQTMDIEGSRFNVTLSSPGDGLQIDNVRYNDGTTLSWTHEASGDTTMRISNTGQGDLEIRPVIVRSSDPVWIAFDFMVIISGIIIIGFSLGFATRRPKGF